MPDIQASFFAVGSPTGGPLVRAALATLVLAALFLTAFWVCCTQPAPAGRPAGGPPINPERLREHVLFLAETCHPRSWCRPQNLDLCAEYIRARFEQTGAPTQDQEFVVGSVTCRNVRVLLGPITNERIVVGAHYDAVSGTPGADDNASGVAGLIELANRLATARGLGCTVELVAYTLEEPPFFRTPNMGSYRHAALLRREGITVRAMLALEMIGYYRTEPRTQRFPFFLLRAFYPHTGNYLVVAGNLSQWRLARKITAHMKGATPLPVFAITAPRFVPGIDLSDHRSYWRHGFPAVMVTDTAFYRNLAYHTPQDTPDRLDYTRMAWAVAAVEQAVLALAGGSGPETKRCRSSGLQQPESTGCLTRETS